MYGNIIIVNVVLQYISVHKKICLCATFKQKKLIATCKEKHLIVCCNLPQNLSLSVLHIA